MAEITKLQDVADFTKYQTQYNLLLEQAKAQGVSVKTVDDELLASVKSGKSIGEAINTVGGQLPQLPQPNNVDLSRFAQWVAIPSPGALVMSTITKLASEQRQRDSEIRRQQTEAIAKNMEDEAKEMREKAKTQLIMGIVSGAVQIGAGAAAIGAAGRSIAQGAKAAQAAQDAADATAKGTTDAAKVFSDAATNFSNSAKIADAVGNALGNAIGKGISGGIDAGAQYVGTMADAEVKKKEAEDEKMRAMRDALKDFDDSLKQLIEKTLATADAIQQQQNQTRAKILG
jgi:hypothetical protein